MSHLPHLLHIIYCTGGELRLLEQPDDRLEQLLNEQPDGLRAYAPIVKFDETGQLASPVLAALMGEPADVYGLYNMSGEPVGFLFFDVKDIEEGGVEISFHSPAADSALLKDAAKAAVTEFKYAYPNLRLEGWIGSDYRGGQEETILRELNFSHNRDEVWKVEDGGDGLKYSILAR